MALIFILVSLIEVVGIFRGTLAVETYNPTTCDQLGIAGGFICKGNCKIVTRCVQTSTGLIELDINVCNDDLNCNSVDGTCTKGITACSVPDPDNAFKCSSPGTYPDPYDCQRYYICNSSGSKNIVVCSGTTAYDSTYNNCGKTIRDTVCSAQPHFHCNDTITRGVWKENRNIYYYCYGDTTITMVRCDKPSQVWDSSGSTCITNNFTNSTNSQTPTTAIPTVTTPSTSIPTTTIRTTTTVINSDSGFACSKAGVFADTSDCTFYFSCFGQPLVAKRYQCPNSFYFNSGRRTCVKGSC